MKNTALLIIDIQKDYFEGGRYPLNQSDNPVQNAAKLLQSFRNQKAPVFHIQHISTKEDATFFLPGSEGVEIHSAIKPSVNEAVIVKHSPNSFWETDLLEELRHLDITDLVICGMMSHHCIDSTVRSGKELGFRITLIHDACTTRNLYFLNETIDAAIVHKVFMAALKGFAEVVDTETFLDVR